jgi:hypothetical protein
MHANQIRTNSDQESNAGVSQGSQCRMFIAAVLKDHVEVIKKHGDPSLIGTPLRFRHYTLLGREEVFSSRDPHRDGSDVFNCLELLCDELDSDSAYVHRKLGGSWEVIHHRMSITDIERIGPYGKCAGLGR